MFKTRVAAKRDQILILTDRTYLNSVQTSEAELSRKFRGPPPGVIIPSQTVGHLAFLCERFDGIKFHSAVRLGFVNYVIFRDRLSDDAAVTAI